MLILRDTREKENKGWIFSEDNFRTEDVTLPTGDYTIKGYENDFIIERKACISEFASNITQDRFFKELGRFDSFKWAFLILEFQLSDIMVWPVGSGVPNPKIQSKFILKRLNEFQIHWNVKIIFAGAYGKEMASSLFKRVSEFYG